MNSVDLTVAASVDIPNGDDYLGDLEYGSYRDHIHLGAEVILVPRGPVSLTVRAGNNQGFITYGATLQKTAALFGRQNPAKSLTVGAIKRFSIKREPFRFDKMSGAPENLQTKFEALAPQPNRDRQLPTGV